MLTYTTNELCRELHTSRDTLQMLREEGALIAYNGGNHGYLYYEADVRRFLERFRGKCFTQRSSVRKEMRNAK